MITRLANAAASVLSTLSGAIIWARKKRVERAAKRVN